MSLSGEQKSKLKEQMSNRHISCWSCGATSWQINDLEQLRNNDSGSSEEIEKKRQPRFSVASATCINCGHIMLFDVAIAGIPSR